MLFQILQWISCNVTILYIYIYKQLISREIHKEINCPWTVRHVSVKKYPGRLTSYGPSSEHLRHLTDMFFHGFSGPNCRLSWPGCALQAERNPRTAVCIFLTPEKCRFVQCASGDLSHNSGSLLLREDSLKHNCTSSCFSKIRNTFRRVVLTLSSTCSTCVPISSHISCDTSSLVLGNEAFS